MARKSEALSEALEDTGQLVEFAGGAAAATALVGAVDLSAAALYRLYFGAPRADDPSREADVNTFFGKEESLPDPAKTWLRETRGASEWKTLKLVGDQFVHRWFPIHITISLDDARASRRLDIGGDVREVADFLSGGRDYVIDRIVSCGLIMERQPLP